MVEHGAEILAQVRRRGRELEAQTSIKRGYLNLLHAREAIAPPRRGGRGPQAAADRCSGPEAGEAARTAGQALRASR